MSAKRLQQAAALDPRDVIGSNRLHRSGMVDMVGDRKRDTIDLLVRQASEKSLHARSCKRVTIQSVDHDGRLPCLPICQGYGELLLWPILI